jgi:hypothetical protein
MENIARGHPRGGEIVSEYSNTWIDMRHDNALNSQKSVSGRARRHAETDSEPAAGPSQWVQIGSQSVFRRSDATDLQFPATDRPHAADSDVLSNSALGNGSTGFAEAMVKATGRGR